MPTSDDFFSAELKSGPPPRLSSTNTARQRRPPPPPPPRKTEVSPVGAASGISGNSMNARPRPAPPNKSPVSGESAGSTKPERGGAQYSGNRTVGGVTPSSTAPTSRSAPSAVLTRKAPVMTRPVGSYYSSGLSAPIASKLNSTTGDWGATMEADTTDWSNSGGNATQSAAEASSSSDDWYSGGNNATATASSNPYSTPGFYNGIAASKLGSTGNSSTLSSFNHPPSNQEQNEKPQMRTGTGFYQNPSEMQQNQHQLPLSGYIDSSAPHQMIDNSVHNFVNTDAGPSFSMFIPSVKPQEFAVQSHDSVYPPLDEAPLLEELGINIEHIFLKTKAVVLPFSRLGGDALDPTVICADADLAGPIALGLLLGGEMVLSGKLQFGYIYGFGVFGCIAMTFVVNLVAPHNPISFWTVASILGYSLLPVNLLAFLKIFVVNLINLQTLGRVLGIVTVAWSTTASTRLFELGCDLRSQRYLIAYPIALLYSAFVLMTIF